MKRIPLSHLACSLLLGLALILVSHAPLRAGSFSWSGAPIVGEDPSFLPSGSAVYEVSGTILTILLTNDTSQTIRSIGQVLTGLTWDISNGVTLTPRTALIAGGSQLINPSMGFTNLSGEWAFRDDIAAGSSLGSFGIGAMGDIIFEETFGVGDCFALAANGKCASVFGTTAPGNVDAGIVGPNFSPNMGFGGPVVQNAMIFTFEFAGSLMQSDITNVQPLFGTDGATLVPEPTSLLLLGSGLFVLGLFGRKRIKGVRS